MVVEWRALATAWNCEMKLKWFVIIKPKLCLMLFGFGGFEWMRKVRTKEKNTSRTNLCVLWNCFSSLFSSHQNVWVPNTVNCKLSSKVVLLLEWNMKYSKSAKNIVFSETEKKASVYSYSWCHFNLLAKTFRPRFNAREEKKWESGLGKSLDNWSDMR